MTIQPPITSGPGGLPWLFLQSPDGAQAQVSLHGGHLTSWIPASGEERLFLSPKAEYSPHAAIRGGIPVLFPQFSTFGPLHKHGFARTQTWKARCTILHDGLLTAFLSLTDNEDIRREWQSPFLLELMVTLGGDRLSLTLYATNTGAEVFRFTAGLHTYLSVSDITNVQVSGLQDATYVDQADGYQEKKQTEYRLTIDGEMDRIYFHPRPELTLQEGETLLRIGKRGFTDTVIWNPGAIASAKLADLAPDSYRRFVCIEAATIARPVRLAPGESWQGTQLLHASHLSESARRMK